MWKDGGGGRRTRDEGRGTKDEGRRTRVEGRGSKDGEWNSPAEAEKPPQGLGFGSLLAMPDPVPVNGIHRLKLRSPLRG